MVLLSAGCSQRPPIPTSTPAPSTTPTGSASEPGASPAIGARLDVTLGGAIGCALFPYGCRATISVLPPDTPRSGEWRPPRTDAWWAPDWSRGSEASRFDPTPVGELPLVRVGRSEVVVLVLGSSDLVSFLPDGTVAEQVRGSCALPVTVAEDLRPVVLRITFVPGDGQTFDTGCRIERG